MIRINFANGSYNHDNPKPIDHRIIILFNGDLKVRRSMSNFFFAIEIVRKVRRESSFEIRN